MEGRGWREGGKVDKSRGATCPSGWCNWAGRRVTRAVLARVRRDLCLRAPERGALCFFDGRLAAEEEGKEGCVPPQKPAPSRSATSLASVSYPFFPSSHQQEAAAETILTPRFYTTDFDEMEDLFSLEKNPNLKVRERKRVTK